MISNNLGLLYSNNCYQICWWNNCLGIHRYALQCQGHKLVIISNRIIIKLNGLPQAWRLRFNENIIYNSNCWSSCALLYTKLELPSLEVPQMHFDIWPWSSIPDELWSWPISMQRSLSSKVRAEINGRTNGRTESIALPASLMHSVNWRQMNIIIYHVMPVILRCSC